MSNEWQNGYSAGYQNGFEAGYQKAKSEGQKSPYSTPNQNDWLRGSKIGTTCHTCGMFFEAGKAYGYVCPHNHCPSKAYCSTIPLTSVSTTRADTSNPYASATWGSWMTGRPMTDNMNHNPYNITPDGMSYEEIYGSVVYQQGRKST